LNIAKKRDLAWTTVQFRIQLAKLVAVKHHSAYPLRQRECLARYDLDRRLIAFGNVQCCV